VGIAQKTGFGLVSSLPGIWPSLHPDGEAHRLAEGFLRDVQRGDGPGVCVPDGLCQEHRLEWREAREAGSSRAAFLTAASPWPAAGMPPARCMICPDRPSRLRCVPRCGTRHGRWRHAGYPGNEALQEWLCEQTPFPGYGECQVQACPDPAVADAGLCHCHEQRYARDGRPGGARGPKSPDGPIQYSGKAEFLQWCATAAPAYRQGLINLRGLLPLIKAEIQ